MNGYLRYACAAPAIEIAALGPRTPLTIRRHRGAQGAAGTFSPSWPSRPPLLTRLSQSAGLMRLAISSALAFCTSVSKAPCVLG